MPRMRFTTEAMNLFTKSLVRAHEKGGVGSENLDIGLPDTTANLKVREGVRKTFGGKVDADTVQNLQKSAFDGGQVTDDEAVYLLKLGLSEDNFETTNKDGQLVLTDDARAARFDLLRFAVMHLADIDPNMTANEADAALAANSQVMREYVKGTVRAIVSTGEADSVYLQEAQKTAAHVRASAAVSDVAIDATAPEMLEVFLEQTEAIGGWSFLKPGGDHNVLVKPGINWGINGYPTVSSWESVYASTLGAHQKAGDAGVANMLVTVADESGIENKDFGRTTMDNMEDTGILGGAILAGVEQSFRDRGLSGSAAHDAAVAHMAEALKKAGVDVPEAPAAADVAPLVRRDHTDLIALAEEAGVVVIPLDEQETRILRPVVKGEDEPLEPGEARVTQEQFDAMSHFKDGIRVSVALDDVTDIINLPKPPGRHGIMSNCGLTGAVKNHIGLLSGVDRSENLHSKWARTPPRREGEDAGNYVDRIKEFVEFLGPRGVNRDDVRGNQSVADDKAGLGDWQANEEDLLQMAEEWVANMKHESQQLAGERGNEAEGPGQQWFEKLAELEVLFKDKTAFTFTDMRKTVSSFGPDFGEQLDVGKVLASDSAAVVDALASAELKRAYEEDENRHDGKAEFAELENNKPGLLGLPGRLLARVRGAMSATYKEAQGAQFLRGGDPFVLKNHAAVMAMPGLAPTDMSKVQLKMAPASTRNSEYLGKKSDPLSTRLAAAQFRD